MSLAAQRKSSTHLHINSRIISKSSWASSVRLYIRILMFHCADYFLLVLYYIVTFTMAWSRFIAGLCRFCLHCLEWVVMATGFHKVVLMIVIYFDRNCILFLLQCVSLILVLVFIMYYIYWWILIVMDDLDAFSS